MPASLATYSAGGRGLLAARGRRGRGGARGRRRVRAADRGRGGRHRGGNRVGDRRGGDDRDRGRGRGSVRSAGAAGVLLLVGGGLGPDVRGRGGERLRGRCRPGVAGGLVLDRGRGRGRGGVGGSAVDGQRLRVAG